MSPGTDETGHRLPKPPPPDREKLFGTGPAPRRFNFHAPVTDTKAPEDKLMTNPSVNTFDEFMKQIRADLGEIIWSTTPKGTDVVSVVDGIITAGWTPDIQPGMDESFPAVWMHCSPELLSSGVSCGATPRRACRCPNPGSHDHLVDQSWVTAHWITPTKMQDLLADDASTFPDGHPCRDCGRLYKDHPTDFCEGWR